MKKLMRKAVTVLGSVAFVGATISGAAAASYPAPFDSGSYAVVYGSADDVSAATTVANGLPAMSGSVSVSEGGDSYMFEKNANKLNIGELLSSIDTSLDDSDLPGLLAEGEYTDDNNDDFDTKQSVTISNTSLRVSLFEDSDYARDEPTVGIHIANNDAILTYELDFKDKPTISTNASGASDTQPMENTDLTFMGRQYYILSTTTTEIQLLDSASDIVLKEGESQSVVVNGKTYAISISFIGTNDVTLVVNGEVTNSLNEGETYKLSDDSYVGVKDIQVQDYAEGVKQVEFSIGNGKLVLTNGQTVELNDDDVDGVTATISTSSTATKTEVDSISLTWTADDEFFITEDSTLTMPGFETFEFAITGVNFPSKETVVIENDGDESIKLSNFPMFSSEEDITILSFNKTDGNVTYIGDTGVDQQLSLDGTFVEATDEWSLFTYKTTDEVESYLLRGTNWKDTSGDEEVTIQYKDDGIWKDAEIVDAIGDEFSIGSLDFTVSAVNFTSENFTLTASDLLTNWIYTEDGMGINLTALTTVTAATQSVTLDVYEEDEDGNVNYLKAATVTLGTNTDKEAQVSSYSVNETYSGPHEKGDSDVFQSYVESELATEVLADNGPDQQTLTLVYHDEEVVIEAYLTSKGAVVGGSSGTKTFMDSESSSYSGKDIVVVGGSCVNSVAASLLGGSFCGDAFTGATTVGPGQFLIQSFDWDGNTATVVAGYEMEDTAKGATFLANEANEVSTDAGDKYVGSTTDSTAVMVN